MDAKMRKAFVEVFEKTNTACDTIIQTKATTRKALTRHGQRDYLKKLKYAVNFPELGLASLHPTDIVYANEVWVTTLRLEK